MKFSADKLYQYLVIVLALLLFSNGLSHVGSFAFPGIIPLLLLGILVETIQIPLGRGNGSLTYGVVLGAMVLYGSYAASLLVVVAVIVESLIKGRNKQRSWTVQWFNAAQYAISVFLSHLVFGWLGGSSSLASMVTSWHILILLPVTMVYMIVNHLFIYGLFYFRGDQLRKSDYIKLFVSDALNYLISTPFAVFMLAVSHYIAIIFLTFLPLLLFGQVLKLYRKITQLNKVHEVTHLLQSEFDLTKLYRNIVKSSQRLTNSAAVVLWVLRDGRLYPVSVSDESLYDQLPADGLPLEEPSIVTGAVRDKRVEVVHDVWKDKRVNSKRGVGYFESILVVPLRSRDEVLGVITCYGTRTYAFWQDQIEMLTVLAGHVGVLIENANLYQELQEATLRDPGTGLYNYRYFYQELSRRFQKAKDMGRPLSIVILDIDHFKKYNDTYGHVVGDEVLRQTGQLVQKTVGDRGVVARYGGEEFAVLLDEPLEQAKGVVEHIRRAVAHNRFEYQGYVVQGVTISAGVATFPDHDQDEKELLEKADQAMYWGAKQRGRNKVAVYTPDFDAHLFVDQLTGLYTYHYLHIKMMEEFTAVPKASEPQRFALIFLNIVEFDQINRRFGFEVGNQVLREMSMLIKQNVRTGEIASRYGGDEFLLLVPTVERVEAEKICERLLKVISEHPFRVRDNVIIRVHVRSAELIFPDEVAEEQQLLSTIPETFLQLSSEWMQASVQKQDA